MGYFVIKNKFVLSSVSRSLDDNIPDDGLEGQVQLEQARPDGDGVVDVVLVAFHLC